MKDVQVWMGHSSFATTANIYAHIDTDSKQEAADMISACISLSGSPDKKVGKKVPLSGALEGGKKAKFHNFQTDFQPGCLPFWENLRPILGKSGRQLGRHGKKMSAKQKIPKR